MNSDTWLSKKKRHFNPGKFNLSRKVMKTCNSSRKGISIRHYFILSRKNNEIR